MSTKENVKDQVVTEAPAEEEKPAEPKMRKRIHFQNPFKVETIEVPVKVKKEKKAKEPKPEKPAKQKFGVGFSAGFAAGAVLGAGAGFLTGHAKNGPDDELPIDDEEVEISDEDLVSDDPGETEETEETES